MERPVVSDSQRFPTARGLVKRILESEVHLETGWRVGIWRTG